MTDPACWTVAEIGGRAGLTRTLTPAEIEGLRGLAERFRDVAPDSVTRADFTDPAIATLTEDLRHAIYDGRGAAIVSGLPAEMTDEATLALLFWGLGTHLGTAVPQSYRKDMIGKVQKEIQNPTGRGYLMDVELKPHCDFHLVMGLCGVRSAQSGGESGVVSSLALRRALADRDPEALALLERGYFQGRHTGTMSDGPVPVFHGEGREATCFHHSLFYHAAAQRRGEDLPEDFAAALKTMVALSEDPEFKLEFMLEPGEMLFWHNFTALHARRSFENAPGATERGEGRLLLRLWLNAAEGETPGRPVPDMFLQQAREMDELHMRGEKGLVYAGLKVMERREADAAAD